MKNPLTHWRLIVAAPFLFPAMLALLIFGFVSMEVRNIGRWINVIGEALIGEHTLYRDLWPLTMGSLWETYKDALKGE